MQWYPWLNPSYQQTISQHLADRAHHAQIIEALPGMGVAELVWAIARWLLCTQPDGAKSCGQCRGCQLMQAGNHPDWYVITAEGGKTTLGIDAVRHSCEKLWHSAQQGGARVVWLDGAEQLTEAAANALLKTLEEPPANCWFLLTTDRAATLPATLRSRCLQQHLAPPAEAASLQWLARHSSQPQLALQAALRLTGGAPVAAQQLLTSPRWSLRQRLAEALLTAIPEQPMKLLPLLNQEQVAETIHWLITLLLDAWKMQQGSNQWLTNPDQPEVIAHLSRHLTQGELDWHTRHWMQCRYRLISRVAANHELLLTEALLAWEMADR